MTVEFKKRILLLIMIDYRTLHKQNNTGKNIAMAIVIGQNQLSSDEYGSLVLGPDVRLNFCCSLLSLLSPHSTSPPSLGLFSICCCCLNTSNGTNAGNSVILDKTSILLLSLLLLLTHSPDSCPLTTRMALIFGLSLGP